MPYKSLVITPSKYSEQQTAKVSQFYRGFSTVDNTKTDSRLYDFDLIRQDLLNEFNVRQSERVMMPGFGCVIWDLLFEPFTDAIKTKISDDITRIVTADPRVNVIEVNVASQEYGMLVELTLFFDDVNKTEVIKLAFDKQTGLTVS